MDEFLNTLQLRGLEVVFRIQTYGIKDDRNKFLPSGFYLLGERDMSATERQMENWRHYDTAASHLSL